MGNNVLVIGGGGREHALGWKLAQSYKVDKVFYAPGNGGTADEEKGINVPIDGSKKENFPLLERLIIDNNIGLTIVGPERPLADGIVNYFHEAGYGGIFGPTREQARLESDRFYFSELMAELGIPQAKSLLCAGKHHVEIGIKKFGQPVLKSRRLADGKGVRVYDSQEEAIHDVELFINDFGDEVVVSERLYGEEFSIFGIADGRKLVPIEMSFQDHKQLLDGDKGPNTGGMGAYGPAPVASREIVRKIAEEMMEPVVKEIGFNGFLYAGMMMTSNGPKVLEFNVRFGDPECQPAMRMLKSDLYEILSSSLEGRLGQVKIELNPGAASCVVLAAKGYPGDYDDRKGLPILGINSAERINGVKVFHAGTKKERYHTGKIYEDNDIVVNGGRVLGLTNYSPNGIKDSLEFVYKGTSGILEQTGKEVFVYRTDIGSKAFRSRV